MCPFLLKKRELDKIQKPEKTSGLYGYTIKSSRRMAEVVMERKTKAVPKCSVNEV